MKKLFHRQGFTLIEMSIVLVIIGLLIAAIVGGKNLLETARINSVIADFTKYRNAYNSFKQTYNAIPGDMPDACDIFGAPNVAPGNENGNSDGEIHETMEKFLAWKHLELAGLIEGKYTGTAVATCVSGSSIPAGQHPASGFFMTYIDLSQDYLADASDTNGFDYQYEHKNANALAYFKTGAGCESNSILIPNDAHLIDIKTDDGNGLKGKVVSSGGASGMVGKCIDNKGGYFSAVTYESCMIANFLEEN